MGSLDLKKLSKGMNIYDKMKLLFEDSNKKAETNNKEYVLTPQEREAIIEDARKSNEINEINRVNDLYLLATYTSVDLEMYNLTLLLSITLLEKSLMRTMLSGVAQELTDKLIYDMASQNSVNKSDIEKKTLEFQNKYQINSILLKGFNFFDPPIKDDSFLPDEFKNENLQPNPDIQRIFIISYMNAKKLYKKLYEMEYIISKSPIDFLPSYTKKLIQECEILLESFSNLDSSLRPLRIYKDYGEAFIRKAKLDASEFLKLLKDIPLNLKLQLKEKENLETKIDIYLEKSL